MVDLAKYDVSTSAEKGAECALLNPFDGKELLDDDGKPIIFMIFGRDSKAVKQRQKDLREKRAKDEMDDEEFGLRILCTIIGGWSSNVEYRGKKLPYSEENAYMLLSDPDTDWIADQIAPFSAARMNFVKNSQSFSQHSS